MTTYSSIRAADLELNAAIRAHGDDPTKALLKGPARLIAIYVLTECGTVRFKNRVMWRASRMLRDECSALREAITTFSQLCDGVAYTKSRSEIGTWLTEVADFGELRFKSILLGINYLTFTDSFSINTTSTPQIFNEDRLLQYYINTFLKAIKVAADTALAFIENARRAYNGDAEYGELMNDLEIEHVYNNLITTAALRSIRTYLLDSENWYLGVAGRPVPKTASTIAPRPSEARLTWAEDIKTYFEKPKT